MKSCSEYIAQAKAALGNPAMGDRELGELLGGYSQQTVNKAKSGAMSDPMAMRIAAVLGIAAGEVIMVARLEREKDVAVREALTEWAGNVFALMPSKGAPRSGAGVRVAKVLAPVALALGLQGAPAPAQAAQPGQSALSLYIMLTTMNECSDPFGSAHRTRPAPRHRYRSPSATPGRRTRRRGAKGP